MTLRVSPYTNWPSSSNGRGSAVALGIFDGVHVGHRALLARALACAHRDDLYSAAFTFHPHPARVFRARYAPKLIEPMAARLAHFNELGIDRAVVQPFDTEFAATSPQAFVTDVLVDTLRVRHVIVGGDFVFGYRQSGNVELLRELGQTHQFTVHVIEPVRVDGMVASSTKVREFVHDGDLTGASALLGRPYALHVHGPAAADGTVRCAAELVPPPGTYHALWTSPSKTVQGSLRLAACAGEHEPTARLSMNLAQELAEAKAVDTAFVLRPWR
jgi:FAD synthase